MFNFFIKKINQAADDVKEIYVIAKGLYTVNQWIKQDECAQFHGVECTICDLKLPPNHQRFDIFRGVICFWDKTELEKQVQTGWGIGVDTEKKVEASFNQSVTVKTGTKIYKYFRFNEKPFKYYCANCFAKKC